MEYDVIIIGAGPAGYVAALRASQVGMRTALIEKSYIGGMCINWGCIPTKAIMESAKVFSKTKKVSEFGIDGVNPENLVFNWENVKARSIEITRKMSVGIESLLKKHGVDIIWGEAIINNDKSVNVKGENYIATNLIIATGSHPAEMDNKHKKEIVINIDKLFDLNEIPESVVVFGKGGSAVELAQFFYLVGKKVALITDDKKILPGFDEYLQTYIIQKLRNDGVEFITSGNIENYKDGILKVNGKQIKCDKIINCSFRKAILPESRLNIDTDDRGYIKVDKNFETNQPGVYAIGDVTGKSYLSYIASAQGNIVINKIKGIQSEFSPHNYPLNVYSLPEISQIGSTEQTLITEGIEYKITQRHLSFNGKALIEGNTEGFVRFLSDKKYGQVLGVQIIAATATDMIAEASVIMQNEGSIYDVTQIIHAHPTISEIYTETGFEAMYQAMQE
jgi:dihydrolipoamide dehydrogenase